MPAYEFVMSSHSGGNAGQECVEVARNLPGVIAVRDSKTPDGPILQVVPDTWTTFIRSLHQAHP
ncbi:DUF397 domain-containing protein [Streptomyces sp. NBC_00882]|uniref:DUF397 domain-containing protein n=1 Tax=Streptomyces TaxID=1883 RepID=UPI00386C60D5|nr:DUF397 domain-containing protein [Streptomyces sp. NBC_00882]WSZ59484.1 DUF397 domain-containing protein [Streptomyces canus]